jgi:hypothetical protein
MPQPPRPSLSLYFGFAVALIQWALSLFGVTVNLWLGCILWAVVTGLFVDFVWRSDRTANKSKLTRALLTGGVVIIMALLAWKPVTDQYEREHTKAVFKLEASPQLQKSPPPPQKEIVEKPAEQRKTKPLSKPTPPPTDTIKNEHWPTAAEIADEIKKKTESESPLKSDLHVVFFGHDILRFHYLNRGIESARQPKFGFGLIDLTTPYCPDGSPQFLPIPVKVQEKDFARPGKCSDGWKFSAEQASNI